MRKLNRKQEGYVQNVARGLPREQSAIMAGYAPTENSTPQVHESTAVQIRLAEIRAETAANKNVTKEEVIQMLLDAAGYAKLLGDPMGLVAAAREIGKMCGFYAPEIKKVLHGLDKNQMKKALQEMNDEELFRLANARTLDGIATLVPEKM